MVMLSLEHSLITAACGVQAAVYFRHVGVGQNVVILESSMAAVQIGQTLCKPWYRVA